MTLPYGCVVQVWKSSPCTEYSVQGLMFHMNFFRPV